MFFIFSSLARFSLNFEHGTNCNFKKQLNVIESLINQFNTRFSNCEMLRKDLILFENPFIRQIEKQNLKFLAEIYDLQCDLSLKTRLEKVVDFSKILDSLCDPRCVTRNFGF